MHTLEDYGLDYRKVQMSIDNISSINLTKKLVYHSRTKHIEVKYYFVRDHIANRGIILKYIKSKSNIADFL